MENVTVFQLISAAMPLLILIITAYLRSYIGKEMTDLKLSILTEIESRVKEGVSGFMSRDVLQEKFAAMRSHMEAMEQRISSNAKAIDTVRKDSSSK